MKEREHLEEPGAERKIKTRIMFRKVIGGGAIDWIKLSQDRDSWRALVNVVMNFRVP